MRLRKARICGVWAAVALAATTQGAWAQDASSPSATPAARTAAGADQSAPPQSQAPVHAGATTTASAAPITCFKLTLHCFGGKSAPADPASPASVRTKSTPAAATRNAATDSPSAASRSLNLAPPDIRTIVSAEELKEPLPSEEQQSQESDTDTVDVRTDPDSPNVPGGFGALWWAMRHPTQVWRIFAPVE